MTDMDSISEKIDALEQAFAVREPQVLAFIPEEGRFERLRREAAALLKRFPSGAARPALFGRLLGVKDIFHVAGFPTQAGSRLPAGELAGPESAAVTRLVGAGALIVGKTVTTEFAYFGPGPTRNPYNPAHTPGGSSSGSAAAVAAGLCELAVGTQTIGSINRPAAFCGVFGYKPSYDRILRAGVIPLAETFDHVGLFSSSIEELEAAAGVLARGWQRARLQRAAVLAVPRGPYLSEAEPEGLDHFERTLDLLRSSGMELRDEEAFSDFDQVFERHQRVLAVEAARVHRDWFRQFGDLYHPKTRDLILRGQSISAEAYQADLQAVSEFRRTQHDRMIAEGIDAWITPSAPGPAPASLDSTGNPVMNLPWTQAGLPTLTIPSGRSAGNLPMAIQLVGQWFRDEKLFPLAASIQPYLERSAL